jgi:hypothetical protein
MNFKIVALDHTWFEPFFQLSDDELKGRNIVRMKVDAHPGYPCRVSLQDAGIGEEVLLLPYEHHKVGSPYLSIGPVYVRKGKRTAELRENEIPDMLNHRLLSFRCYDKDGMMISARTDKGTNTRKVIEDLFALDNARYIHIHNASPGCFNCEVRRID